ncbi:bacterio-opsin activator HTH domain-containing protein [Natrialba hulunbeirensis JCM 10989]|uniref:Bacterio-opsin activator HTH domain-containing protein n=1 Tax=Natrialba hulunbeirensis JCM 10989 TaxID=1227493 RepID=M0A9G2_9EURY|nr:helix-turn-helix domain-containing protein [Natrialba hulunbeirensis]ELY95174.1 bacterio-opsin activator HTH domain-containing protein [Natrialba hulunbeirensis JCM 10989]
MSLIVEYELRTPILESTAQVVRKLELEELYGTQDGTSKLLFWAFADDFDAFEDALTSDETIESYTRLESFGDRSLYGVTLTDEAAAKLTYPLAAEYNVAITDITVSDKTIVSARVPSRETLLEYRKRCLEKGVGFQVRRIYHEHESEAKQYGLSEHQREALLTALERGYFDVPRAATLSEVADELGISDQALSARLRRGQANLLWHTIADDPT